MSAETHDRNERAGIPRGEGEKSAMSIPARATRNEDEKHTGVVI